MRVVKDPVVRKQEILDAAEALFTTKGYNETSIGDIVRAVRVAKGTFYYYYRSKEEILDAVLLRIMDEDKRRMAPVLNDPSLPPILKLAMLILAQGAGASERKDQMAREFHKPGNAEMHQRGTQLALKHLAPIMAQVVREGVEQRVFYTETPLEDMEMILSAASLLFDEGLAQYSAEEIPQKGAAFFENMGRILGAPSGAFDEARDLLLAERE